MDEYRQPIREIGYIQPPFTQLQKQRKTCLTDGKIHYQVRYIIRYDTLSGMIHYQVRYIIRYDTLSGMIHYQVRYIIRYDTLSGTTLSGMIHYQV